MLTVVKKKLKKKKKKKKLDMRNLEELFPIFQKGPNPIFIVLIKNKIVVF